MFLIVLVAIAVGLPAMALTVPNGVLTAVIAGPCAGSLAGLAASVVLAWFSRSAVQDPHDLDQRADEMVAALRALAEQGQATQAASAVAKSNSAHAA